MTTCAVAIKAFEAKSGETATEAKIVKLYCQIPPIAKLDSSLNNLTACEHPRPRRGKRKPRTY